jgi:hypothetical protein
MARAVKYRTALLLLVLISTNRMLAFVDVFAD